MKSSFGAAPDLDAARCLKRRRKNGGRWSSGFDGHLNAPLHCRRARVGTLIELNEGLRQAGREMPTGGRVLLSPHVSDLLPSRRRLRPSG